jgi:hypothetical protein
VTSCCPSNADAGPDTSFCDTPTYALTGNSVPNFSTASWTVTSGTSVLSNSLLPNTNANNMSYGLNQFVWTMVDSVCTTRDTLNVINDASPTNVVTEPDKMICTSATIVNAQPPTIGVGKWHSVTVGLYLFYADSLDCRVSFLKPGINTVIWKVKNGVCPAEIDTLHINYVTHVDTPIITSSGSILTSTSAPNYQWHEGGTFITIAGANAQSFTATKNGPYYVETWDSSCPDQKLISNEIDVQQVGIGENEGVNTIQVSPNPSIGNITVTGLVHQSEISLFTTDMKRVYNSTFSNSRVDLDFSELDKGMYILQIRSNENVVSKRLILTD